MSEGTKTFDAQVEISKLREQVSGLNESLKVAGQNFVLIAGHITTLAQAISQLQGFYKDQRAAILEQQAQLDALALIQRAGRKAVGAEMKLIGYDPLKDTPSAKSPFTLGKNLTGAQQPGTPPLDIQL